MRIIKIVSAVALSIAMCQPVLASQAKMGMMHDKMQEIVKQLQLTPVQQAQIKTMHEGMETQMMALKEKMMKVNASLHALVKEPVMDETKLDTLIKEKTDLMGQFIKMKMTCKNKLYNLLTPEQKTKMDNLMKAKLNS